MTRQIRTLIVVAVAVVVASIASFAMYRVIQQMPVREIEVASVTAVIAARNIPVGTMLVKEDLKIVAWPARNPIQGGFKSIEQVTNRGLISPVAENEPITEGKLAPLGAGAGLAPTIPAGMRAISVRVNEVIGVAGFVIPGSRVDLVITVTDPYTKNTITKAVVNNIEVLTAGSRFDQEASRSEGKPIQASVVTLLATPQDAEKIGLAASEGSITLTLRNPLDVTPTETQGARLAGLLGNPSPPPIEKRVDGRRVVQAVPPPPPPKVYTVETIRAAKRSEEALR
jgi:pilus assembly protein CpaB